MKKSPLLAAVLLIGLLVGGCSLRGGSGATVTSLSTSTSNTGETTTVSVTSTSTTSLQEDSTTTSEASTTTSETSTTVSGTSTTAVTSAAKAVRYEQSDSHLAYEGRWKIGANAAASGGRYTFADHAGCSVTINFDGTYLSLIAKKSHNYGKASVTLDGTVVATIDLYSVNATYQRKVWNTGTLASGVHKVTIAWTGKKRTAALAANINIDAVDVIGTLQ
jgi:hypothetical protein